MNKGNYGEILKQLTLEEKASLCSGLTFWKTKTIERLGIPSVWLSDGPNGVRKEKQNAGTNIMKPAETATCFPPEGTVACSWDVELIEEMGSALAEEAKARRNRRALFTIQMPGLCSAKGSECFH